MPKGQYNRQPRERHHAAETPEPPHDEAPITVIDRPKEHPQSDPLIFPAPTAIAGHPVHFEPVRVDLALDAAPPTLTPIYDDDPAASEERLDPVRLTEPHAFYDEAGACHSWAAGELVTDQRTIALLRHRGASLTEHVGVMSGIHPSAYPVVPRAPEPATAPLRLTAPFAFVDAQGVRHFWMEGEAVTDPAAATMLRGAGASFEDIVHEVAPVAPIDAPLRLAAPFMFYDDAGERRFWAQGERVDDPETAALLRKLGALVLDA